jgi:hypothetical protein
MLLLIGCPKPGDNGDGDQKIFASADPSPQLEESSKPIIIMNDDLQWLVSNSPLIFIGSIENQDTDIDKNRLIFTNNVFALKEIIIGKYNNKEIAIKTLGGTYKNEVMNVSHMPIFYRGLEYIIFMDPARKTYSPVTANEAGIFIVDSGVVYTYSGQSLVGIKNNKILTGIKKIELPDDRKTSGEKAINTTTPKTSTPDLKIETIDERDIARSERPLRLAEFIEYIQSVAK